MILFLPNATVIVLLCLLISGRMPKYQRISDRGKWSVEAVKEAIEKVRNKEMSLCQASSAYSLPKATLFRHIADRNKIAKDANKHLGRFQTTFDSSFENDLKQYSMSLRWRTDCLESLTLI